EEESTGSARTAGEFDLIAALKPAAHLLSKFGGHRQAAGLTLPNRNLEEFYKVLVAEAGRQAANVAEAVAWLEAELGEADLNLETASQVEVFEPFGTANPRPQFLIKGLVILSLRLVGAAGQHMQAKLLLGKTEVPGIMFNAAGIAKKLKVGDTVDATAELIREEWNGQRLKLKIVEMKINQQSNG
ncbi:MAG: DHHA1 domain-containing protein, partial [Patescibacteria group bacterium]|nr:DHHA1 domain-containing protein [Patescibacteria group bacterium]